MAVRTFASASIAIASATLLSGCCSNSGNEADNPHGIYLEDATLVAMGGLIPTGLPRQQIVVGNGLSIGDVDGDGDVDIVLARISRDDLNTGGPSELYRNGSISGQVFFSVDTAFRELTRNHVVYSSALGDYDGDGDLDLFLGCSGFDLLLENRNDGTFRDVTSHAGVEGPDDDLSTGPVWADVNNDGLLDLFVGDYGGKQRLYINLGDKTFLDVTDTAGVENPGHSHTAAIADFDADGRLDIYLSNDTLAVDDMPPPLASIARDEVFTDVEIDDTGIPHYLSRGMQFGVQKNRSSMGIAAADFNDDGFLDVYVTDSGASDMYLWNNAAGKFDEATNMGTELRVVGEGRDKTLSINWGAMPIDLDRDGALEMFVCNGELLFPAGVINDDKYQQLDHLLRQPRPGAPFVDISASAGMPTTPRVGDDNQLLNGRGAFHGDLDGDGDDDIILGAFNEPFRVWMNDTPKSAQGQYVRVRLKGTVSAPDPIGAILAVQCSDGTQKLGWRVGGGHTYGSSDNVVEVACGAADPVSANVQWPSGLVQPLGDFVNHELLVEEPRWLELTERVVGPRDPTPVLTYLPVDVEAGKEVIVKRSDGLPVTVTEGAEATYVAELPHPGFARRTTLTITVDGEELSIRPMIVYR